MSRDCDSFKCDAFKCSASVAPGRFMCLKHWRLVPVFTQKTINTRYRAGRRDFAFLSDVLYLQACIAAINAVAAAEGHQAATDIGAASSYGRLLRVAQRQQEQT